MFFEHHSKPLLSKKEFFIRVIKYFFIALALIAISLVIGCVGYHYLCSLSWVDSLLNASMILTGMGPVNEMKSDAAKLFASFYALYSGIAFLSTVAVFFAPIVHRFFHILHLGDS